jgi:hypothetical protein
MTLLRKGTYWTKIIVKIKVEDHLELIKVDDTETTEEEDNSARASGEMTLKHIILPIISLHR